MNVQAYQEAVEQNDLAHRKTLVETARDGELSEAKAQEISEEAIMWLKHLFAIHSKGACGNGKQ